MRPPRGRDLHLERAAGPPPSRRRRRTGAWPRRRAELHRDGADRARDHRRLGPLYCGGGMTPLVVLDVVGLTPGLLAHMPALRDAAPYAARLDPVLPAVTCSVQASLLTGLPPSGHGIVANGW